MTSGWKPVKVCRKRAAEPITGRRERPEAAEAEMAEFSRRVFLGGAAMAGLSACANGVGGNGGATIDARVDATRDYLFGRYPGTADLARNARGVLYMPLVTEAGFGIGGGYGRGALRINDVTVD